MICRDRQHRIISSLSEAKVKYDAFISYRHMPLDMEIAKKLHKGLETFHVPAAVRASALESACPVYLHFPVGSSDDPYKVALRFSLTTGKTLPLGHFFLFHLSLRFGLYIDLESCKLGCKTGVLAFLAYCERKL